MKIGLIASNWRPLVEKANYIFAPGKIILQIADGLVDKGHEVTLFAPKGTITKAKLVTEDLNSSLDDYSDLFKGNHAAYVHIEIQYELMLISKAFEMAKKCDFDVLVAHKLKYTPYFSNLVNVPLVLTSHQSYLKPRGEDFPEAEVDFMKLSRYHDKIYFTSISKRMQEEVKDLDLNFIGNVYNGIDLHKFEFGRNGGDSLLFAGRLVESKGPEIAIKAAIETNQRINVIGQTRHGLKNEKYAEIINSILKHKQVAHIGFIDRNSISKYYQQAKALLVPIMCEEAFGLTMAESMACGTPVIAFAKGSVPELIEDGVTGYIINTSDDDIRGDWIIKSTGLVGIVEAINKLYGLPEDTYRKMRFNCRKRVEDKFTIREMVDGYERAYQDAIADYNKKEPTE